MNNGFSKVMLPREVEDAFDALAAISAKRPEALLLED